MVLPHATFPDDLRFPSEVTINAAEGRPQVASSTLALSESRTAKRKRLSNSAVLQTSNGTYPRLKHMLRRLKHESRESPYAEAMAQSISDVNVESEPVGRPAKKTRCERNDSVRSISTPYDERFSETQVLDESAHSFPAVLENAWIPSQAPQHGWRALHTTNNSLPTDIPQDNQPLK